MTSWRETRTCWREERTDVKTIEANGITYFSRVPGANTEWYFGTNYPHGDLYEAEEIYRAGRPVKGRRLCLVHYPDGETFWPLPEKEGTYLGEPAYFDGGIYLLEVDFPEERIRVVRFDCGTHAAETDAELPLASVKDCYNLSFQTTPITLTRQCAGTNEFEIVWPERVSFPMDSHDSFFLRDGEKLFFNRWHEEGDGSDYRYWEETVVRDLEGKILEVLPGDVQLMPNGELWHIRP